jgi:hypothetical protein
MRGMRGMRGMGGFRPRGYGRPLYRPRRVWGWPVWGWYPGLAGMGCLLPVLGTAAIFGLAFLMLIF